MWALVAAVASFALAPGAAWGQTQCYCLGWATCPPDDGCRIQVCMPCCGPECYECEPSSNCPTGSVCSPSGVCEGLKASGEPCTGGAECTSGFCRQGVCCQSSCGGSCESCALVPGQCLPLPTGTVCRPAVDACDVEEVCTGAAQCPGDVRLDPDGGCDPASDAGSDGGAADGGAADGGATDGGAADGGAADGSAADGGIGAAGRPGAFGVGCDGCGASGSGPAPAVGFLIWLLVRRGRPRMRSGPGIRSPIAG